jgi:hypothetical protein
MRNAKGVPFFCVKANKIFYQREKKLDLDLIKHTHYDTNYV